MVIIVSLLHYKKPPILDNLSYLLAAVQKRTTLPSWIVWMKSCVRWCARYFRLLQVYWLWTWLTLSLASPWTSSLSTPSSKLKLLYFLDERPVKQPLTSTLTGLAELVLNLNTFTFNNQCCQQVGGVAMGTQVQLDQTTLAYFLAPKYTLREHFTSQSDNVIYCISCRRCPHLYIRKTGRRLRQRFEEHLRSVQKSTIPGSSSTLSTSL